MHILIISSEPFDHGESPMYGIFQKHQANHLYKNNYTVGVLSPLGRSLRFIPNFLKSLVSVSGKRKYNFDVVKNYLWNPFSKFKGLEWLWYKWFGYLLYHRYVRKNGTPDIIHAHNTFHAGRFAVLLKKKYDIPVVLTEHSSVFLTGAFDQADEQIISKVMENSDQIVAVSRSIAKKLAMFLLGSQKKEINIVHNVLDEDFEMEAHFKRQLLPSEHTFTFFNLAGLTEIKNQRLLIRAFSKIAIELNVVLKIGGNGPLYSELNTLINELCMQEYIFLLGHLDRESVKNEFRKSDCFVLTSNHETFGVVLIEALCFGIPLIATKCGGPNEIVDDSNGILVNVNSETDLINALRQIVTFAHNYNSDMIKKRCFKTYSGKAFIENIATVYNKSVVKKK